MKLESIELRLAGLVATTRARDRDGHSGEVAIDPWSARDLMTGEVTAVGPVVSAP